jgi:hypothetical protein
MNVQVDVCNTVRNAKEMYSEFINAEYIYLQYTYLFFLGNGFI